MAGSSAGGMMGPRIKSGDDKGGRLSFAGGSRSAGA